MLQLKNIYFSVKDDDNNTLNILTDISYDFADNQFVVITGPNGSGKSTLAKIIMGIEKPTSGQIILDGENITDYSISDRAKLGIGYGFQHPPRFKGLTVRDLLSTAAGKTIGNDQCYRYLTEVGLCSKDYLDRDVDNSLSGGELKRIEIATILARSLKVSIYDEPEAGIDLWSFTKLTESFKRMHKTQPGLVVIISHQERILDISDQIILLSNGAIKTSGPKAELLPQIIHETKTHCELQKIELEEDVKQNDFCR